MSECEVIGLRVRCPKTNRVITISREYGDYAIGPTLGPDRSYRIRCHCGELHTAPIQSVTKPTKAQRARPANNGKQSR